MMYNTFLWQGGILMKNKGISLTEGSISKGIILFAIPIFLGQLFQQLYNAVDSLIVGNLLGSEALAAVASSGNLIFLMIGFFNGISVGAGVVIARYFGAKEKERLHDAIHTTVAFGLIAGLLLTGLGCYFAPKILILMGTPSSVLPLSTTYFITYFAGSLGLVCYNAFTGILRAVGDSQHPLYYLIFSSILNVILDYIFIAYIHLGVMGAALATIISQFTSALLCLYQLMHGEEVYRVYLKDIKVNMEIMKQVISNGLPAGLQNSVTSLANVVVQSNINSFGMYAMAGSGAFNKIDGFGFLPIMSFALAMTTYISQNLGAKEYERAKKGARFGLLACMASAEVIGIVVYLFAPKLIGLFDSNPEVIRYGTMHARTCALFYFAVSCCHCTAGILRGAGKSIVPMFVMLGIWCVVRVSYITLMMHFFHNIKVVYSAYPFTWILAGIIFLVYYKKMDYEKL